MKRVRAALVRAAQDLSALGRSFALGGGFAVSVRAEPRTTRDVDFLVAVRDDEDAERLAADLVARGYVIVAAIEQTAVGRLATVRLRSPSSAVVDLLFASSGAEAEIIARSDEIEVLRGIRLGVPTVGHLIALKVLSRDDRERPQDRVDLAALLRRATRADLTEAREALELITERGFNRGKQLVDELDGVVAEFPRSGDEK